MDIENPDEAECLAVAMEADLRDRRWVRSITEFLESRVGSAGYDRDAERLPTELDLPLRVRQALDEATIAACGRLKRIMRSDLPPIAPGDAF